jgi:hypothetical protein
MTGKIKREGNYTMEFYYGIGVVAGSKRTGFFHENNDPSTKFSFFGPLSIGTRYTRKDYVFVGIPLEYRVQWRVMGLGFDANLNPYLPYLGIKCNVKLGNSYVRN